MQLYAPDNRLLLDTPVDDKSVRIRSLMGQHNVTIYISHTEPINFQVGCYFDFQGIRYKIRKKSDIKKNASRNLEYTVIFESPQADAEKRTVRNIVDNRLKFPYTALPHEHIQLLVDNLNKIGEGGWKVGECIVAERALITYNHTKCLEALKEIADAFNTEWEIDNKTIHLRKVEYNKENPLPLAYGQGNGFLPGMSRSNVDSSVPIEILAVQGGTRNIDSSKYGNLELLLPKRQSIKFDGAKFDDEEGFDAANARQYVVDAEGLTIQRGDRQLTTYEDGSTDLSNIYPMRIGTVSKVEVTKDGFYNIFDSSIPSNLDYTKYRIGGEKMTLKFETGNLAGKEFDIVQTDKALTGYDHSLRRFMLVSQEYDGTLMPNSTAFSIQIGDKYAVFGMSLPDEYIRDDNSKTGASWDMFREAVKVMYEEEQDKFQFTGELDGIWAKRDWVNIGGRIKLGGYIRFTDDQMIETVDGKKESVLIRITKVQDYINDPYKPKITLANVTAATYAEDFRKIPQNEVKAETDNKETVNFVRRGFRDAKQTMQMLQDALLNFSEGISPVTVQTMQLLAGDESLQFRFVTDKEAPQLDADFKIAFNADSKTLTVTKGILQHMTLGINSLSASHKPSDYKFWDMPAFTSAVLDTPEARYYLYAACSNDNDSTKNKFYLSNAAIQIDSVAGYKYFLVGLLNSEYENNRSFASMYGFTEILPGRITTDSIVSADGKFVIDLLNSYLEIFNAQNTSMIKLDGTDGSGWLAAKNLIWNALGHLIMTGIFQTNTPSGKIGTRIQSDDNGSELSFYNNWLLADEEKGSYLNEFRKNKVIMVWNPNTKKLEPILYFYHKGELRLSGLGGCYINGDEAQFGSSNGTDSYLKINWVNRTEPGGNGTEPVPGDLQIDMRGMKVDDGIYLPKGRVFVDENGFFKLKL